MPRTRAPEASSGRAQSRPSPLAVPETATTSGIWRVTSAMSTSLPDRGGAVGQIVSGDDLRGEEVVVVDAVAIEHLDEGLCGELAILDRALQNAGVLGAGLDGVVALGRAVVADHDQLRGVQGRPGGRGAGTRGRG